MRTTDTPESLRIAENVTLILPLHQELDALRESSNAIQQIGTTTASWFTGTLSSSWVHWASEC